MSLYICSTKEEDAFFCRQISLNNFFVVQLTIKKNCVSEEQEGKKINTRINYFVCKSVDISKTELAVSILCLLVNIETEN